MRDALFSRLFCFACLIIMMSCGNSNRKFHMDSYVADTHNDVLLRVMRGEDITVFTDTGHSDIPRLISGGIDMEVFVCWTDPSVYLPDGSYEQANKMIDALEEIEKKIPDKLEILQTFDDLLRIEQEGKIAAMIGIEGGHAIENSLEKLEHFYKRGMRYLGITWNNSNDWATSAKDETNSEDLTFLGLTDFGGDVVKKCNDLGVIIDVSHCGEKTFWDIMATTTMPIIASHSSVYNICPHFRNLKDDQLHAIKENGGVVFVNFYPGYIDSTFEEKADKIKEIKRDRLDSLKALYVNDEDGYWYARMEFLKQDMLGITPPVEKLIDHIEYIAKLIGVDHVGLGSDFDGVSVLPGGIEDCTKIPVITEKLIDRGYSKSEIRKILGENFKRVFKEVVG